jgi:CRISPR-associated protein Csd1
MNWIQDLYETYENCQSMIGTGSDENEVPLLPICHTTQKAQIEITLDRKGNFRRARVIPKDESRTIIPCTEKSGGRTSGEAPHPLCDKLQYMAAEYKDFGGEKDSYYESYVSLLGSWVNSGAPLKVQLINKYIKRGTAISDLVAHRILFVDKHNRLLIQRSGEKDKTAGLDVFDLLPGGIDPKTQKIRSWQADAFVRWKVEIPNDPETAVWGDQDIIQGWIDYYSSTKETKALCYVTGEVGLSADQHPAKIRNDGDKAKLISSGKSTSKAGKITIDDGCGFTFLGRFTHPDQVAAVGFEATQKAHFALRWLIGRQGYKQGDLAIVAWAVTGASIPKPTDDAMALLLAEVPPNELAADTAQDLALRLKKKMAGYRQDIGRATDVVVMGVDSATPGRMAITYYRKLSGSDFLEKVDDWHTSCAWLHRYRSIAFIDQNGKNKSKAIPFVGAPSPKDIAEAAYGSRVDDKLCKATISRLLPCIIDGQPLPRDLVVSAVRRASNRAGLRDQQDKKRYGDEEYSWKKTLTIACALFRKYHRKENYSMTLDPNRKTRDYLYGRLLALAESLEEWALNKAGEDRPTNAARLMQRFSERPYSTWRTIELALTPYKARLGGKSKKRQRLMDEVVAAFNPEDFTSDKRLSGEFLLGYHSQREYLRPVAGTDPDSETDEIAN